MPKSRRFTCQDHRPSRSCLGISSQSTRRAYVYLPEGENYEYHNQRAAMVRYLYGGLFRYRCVPKCKAVTCRYWQAGRCIMSMYNPAEQCDEGPCQVCGVDPADCKCPECACCGSQGDPKCAINNIADYAWGPTPETCEPTGT